MNLAVLEGWPRSLAILALAAVGGYVARFLVVRRMTLLSARTKTHVDDLLVSAMRAHIPLWFVLGGLALAARNAPISPALLGNVYTVTSAAFLLSLSLVVANLITGLVEHATARAGAGSFVSASLTRNVLRGVVLIIGGLLILERLGQPIGSLLTALGIGSLAVALALQPTLSNLFAGLHIALAKPLRIGDFVELENGIQGYVADIGWRSTTLREGGNNLVIVPNARLVEMVARNYSLPEPEQVMAFSVGVGAASDLEQVERVTREAAREARDLAPEAVKTFEPIVRFVRFGESSIDLQVVLRVDKLPDQAALAHELVKRIKARYEREGIEIPFPHRVVHVARGSLPAGAAPGGALTEP